MRAARSATIFIACTLGACSAGFQATPPEVSRHAASTHTEWLDFYLFGVVGGEESDARDWCPAGHATRIRVGMNWLSALLTFGTLGIYAPRVVSVDCAAP
jgi:hypothetical protein